MPRLDDDVLGQRVRQEATRHAPPPELATRIVRQLRAQAEPVRARPTGLSRWLQAASLFAAGAATTCALLLLRPAAAPDDLVAAVAASHVRSLMAEHLADVRSSDRHTVKPWFAGKLDYSPPVVDLAAQGLPLVGGRLDYLGGRAVAALAYRSGAHVINLFVWPADAVAEAAPQAATLQGWHLLHWTQGGMQAWAVSDASAAELAAFASQWRERAALPP
jgi:anti-sigma factor RsiW